MSVILLLEQGDQVKRNYNVAKYTRTSYSLEELKKRPEELNPNKLETYLSEEDFQVSNNNNYV